MAQNTNDISGFDPTFVIAGYDPQSIFTGLSYTRLNSTWIPGRAPYGCSPRMTKREIFCQDHVKQIQTQFM